MLVLTQEAHIIMAIEAIQSSNQKISRWKAAKIYNVPEATLRDRITGRPSRNNTRPNCQKLTKLEEGVIVQHIFNLDSRGFSP